MMVTEAFKRSLLDYSKKINDCTNTLLNQEAVRHGLTAMQLRLLMELYNDGAMTIGEVAAQLGQAGTNVSTMCKKLETRGLVNRQRSEADERVVMVVLTAIGEEKMKDINKVFDKKINRMMEVVDETELKAMLTGLKKFSDLLSLNTSLDGLPQTEPAAQETNTSAKERD
ncbi:MarR family winged helix-turn-helix transcriptional regulator [Acidaminobacter sp.]|uniref:MarR family winged helix-turn-helix transcriptional regulator n=1 Tax=Acidaminobacter sp. TaxID=1872102 RepID=UPI0013813506|nr:MarR family winged helix-turn-helix transcriptional regulator [Acidaminobacter sp.]MDK9710637.1 MarR family winged helix-turn-helix transcriptional regulator [Acidaminobacter sp.]MZQ96376.1 MarR family transcriptional regulator [Acidaminobacter sp.]